MRHLNTKPHLNRTWAHRKALFGNLSAALFVNRRIVTTLSKAKYARSVVERMITFARKGDVAARRHVLRYVGQKDAVKILFDELGPHFKNRNGGYTRIIKLGTRAGDAAPMALLELVGFDDIEAVGVKRSGKSRLKEAQKEAVKAKVEEAQQAEEAPLEEPEAALEEPTVEPEVKEEKEDEKTKE